MPNQQNLQIGKDIIQDLSNKADEIDNQIRDPKFGVLMFTCFTLT